MARLVVPILFLKLATCLVMDSSGDIQLQLEQERQARQRLDTKVSELEKLVARLDSTVSAECVVNCPAQKPIAFMAQLSKQLNQPANGHVVVFDDVITNQGSAYSNVHGIFTAPVNGTYTFNLVVSSPNDASASHTIHVLLKLNTKTVGYVFLDSNTVYWLRRTTSIVVNMSTGDEIWAEVAGVTGNHALGGCCFHTHLSGFLIETD